MKENFNRFFISVKFATSLLPLLAEGIYNLTVVPAVANYWQCLKCFPSKLKSFNYGESSVQFHLKSLNKTHSIQNPLIATTIPTIRSRKAVKMFSYEIGLKDEFSHVASK